MSKEQMVSDATEPLKLPEEHAIHRIMQAKVKMLQILVDEKVRWGDINYLFRQVGAAVGQSLDEATMIKWGKPLDDLGINELDEFLKANPTSKKNIQEIPFEK